MSAITSWFSKRNYTVWDYAVVGGLAAGVGALLWKRAHHKKCCNKGRERFVNCLDKAGFHKVAYMEWGDPRNNKLAICVHGLTRNKRDFDALAQYLVKEGGYRVVAIDIVGRGNSDWLENKMEYGYEQYLKDVSTVIAHVSRQACGKKCVKEGAAVRIDYIGSSMGGLIGMMLAAVPNNPIRKLVMNDIGPFVSAQATARLATYVGKQQTFDTEAQAEEFMKRVYADQFGPSTDDVFFRHITQHSFKRDPATQKLKLHYDMGLAVPFHMFAEMKKDIELWEVWQKVKVPVLVLRGAKSDVLTRATTDKMLDLFNQRAGPDVVVVEYPETGHLPPLISQDKEDVLRWLAS